MLAMEVLKAGLMLLVILLIYSFALSCYRLFLSPLARFPGPKLTAVTGWYETYCELFKGGGGQFSHMIAKWHTQYGPVVRINPHELHFNDPEFYDVVYAATPANKLRSLENRAGLPGGMFATASDQLHRLRRGALNPYFSRKRVLEFVPRIIKQVDKLTSRLLREFSGTGKVITVEDMVACLFTDINLDYNFDKNDDCILDAEFRDPFSPGILDLQLLINWGTQFPGLVNVLKILPESIITAILPTMANIFKFERDVEAIIEKVRARQELEDFKRTQVIVFDELFRSNLPKSELSTTRLKDEAISLIGAGLETSKRAASVTIFHILNNRRILTDLKSELRQNIQNASVLPSVSHLEQLPVLSGCVQEGLRLAYGAAARSPRVLYKPVTCGSLTIPAGTPISFESWQLHQNQTIYPDCHAFKPERWLNEPKSPAGRPLGQYMASFGRGSRMCIGMHLASAELFITIAALFRRVDFQLFDTDRTAVDLYKVILGPMPKPGTKGVRVTVL